jgi:hypothetical protein
MPTREAAGGPGALPADALEVLPPGARALVEVGDGPVLLHPVEPPGETRDDHWAAAGENAP